jgi:hypothetical protein
MKQLGVEFGVTPQAVSKLCDDHEIPKPGYGYWTLRDMGRPVQKPTLSIATREANELIAIDPKRPRASKPPPPPIKQKLAPPLKLASAEPKGDAKKLETSTFADLCRE